MNRKIKWLAPPLAALAITAAAIPAASADVARHGRLVALDGSDGRFGIGKGRYDHFKPDPRHHRMAPDASFPKMDRCREEDSRECAWDAVHMGSGGGDSFWAPPAGVARVYYTHAPVHRIIFGTWTEAPASRIGDRVDLINGGTRVIAANTIREAGTNATLWAWPGQDRLDYQLGTS